MLTVFGRLFLLFTLVPLVELMLLIEVGERIGALPTVALVVLTGVAGASLARHEGAHAWREVRGELGRGRIPGRELLSALLVLLAGALLVTPGVLTDAAGLLVLVRPLRARVVELLRGRLVEKMEAGELHVFAAGGPGPGDGSGGEGDERPDGWHRRPNEEPPGDGDDEDGEPRRRIIEM